MEDALLIIVQTIFTLLLYHVVLYVKGVRFIKKKPYSWSCSHDQCLFKISSDDPVVVASIGDSHTMFHQSRGEL